MNARQNGLWDFALRLYGAQGVSEACLVLQEESGVDVPVLLFAAWLSEKGKALTEGDLGRVDGRIREWRSEVVQPLRAVRRRLKNGPSPAPSEETEKLRNGVKAVELQSEKIELAVLEAEGDALPGERGGEEDANQNLRRVLRYYRGSEPDESAIQALAVIEAGLQALS